MINRDYATRVLFALSFKDLCGYQLSKSIAAKDERISNGTLNPVLGHLTDKGLIDFRRIGVKKMYFLTDKGEAYVKEVRSIRNELKRRIFVDSMHENALFFDFLSNLDDARLLRELLEYLGDEVMSLVKIGFLMMKSGNMDGLEKLRKKLQGIGLEVNEWLSPEMRS